jgi:hypothetical protein
VDWAWHRKIVDFTLKNAEVVLPSKTSIKPPDRFHDGRSHTQKPSKDMWLLESGCFVTNILRRRDVCFGHEESFGADLMAKCNIMGAVSFLAVAREERAASTRGRELEDEGETMSATQGGRG